MVIQDSSGRDGSLEFNRVYESCDVTASALAWLSHSCLLAVHSSTRPVFSSSQQPQVNRASFCRSLTTRYIAIAMYCQQYFFHHHWPSGLLCSGRTISEDLVVQETQKQVHSLGLSHILTIYKPSSKDAFNISPY